MHRISAMHLSSVFLLFRKSFKTKEKNGHAAMDFSQMTCPTFLSAESVHLDNPQGVCYNEFNKTLGWEKWILKK